MKSSCVTIQMEATLEALDVYTCVHITRSELPMVLFITQYFPVILFVLLHKMVRSFESGMDEWKLPSNTFCSTVHCTR